jgi:hypothetical protein
MKSWMAGVAFALLMGHIAIAADDLDEAYNSLQKAVDAKKPAAELKPLAVNVLTLANKAEAGGDADAAKHAKEVAAYAEYALYTAAIQGPAAVTVDLMGTLEQLRPKSEYLPSGYPMYLAALGPKAGPVAEKALKNFPDNQDLLVAAANSALANNRGDVALGFAKRALGAHPKKPEGMSDADWNRAQATVSGTMHWVAGVVEGSKNQFFECDKDLRASLPAIQGNNGLLGPAYFYLGISNYQMGRQELSKAKVLEGAKFSDQAAAIPGTYQRQAYSNSQLIKAEAAKMR